MEIILLIFILAITVEALVQYGKTIQEMLTKKDYKTAITQGFAIVVSVVLCYATRADLYSCFGVVFALPDIGIILTGIFASRGANYLSDIIKQFQGVKSGKPLT